MSVFDTFGTATVALFDTVTTPRGEHDTAAGTLTGCMVQHSTKLVRNQDGEQSVSTMQIAVPAAQAGAARVGMKAGTVTTQPRTIISIDQVLNLPSFLAPVDHAVLNLE